MASETHHRWARRRGTRHHSIEIESGEERTRTTEACQFQSRKQQSSTCSENAPACLSIVNLTVSRVILWIARRRKRRNSACLVKVATEKTHHRATSQTMNQIISSPSHPTKWSRNTKVRSARLFHKRPWRRNNVTCHCSSQSYSAGHHLRSVQRTSQRSTTQRSSR